MAFHIQNNYGDNYEVQAGATIIAGGIEAALARKEAIDKIKKEAEETGVSFFELMNKYKDNVVDAEVVEEDSCLAESNTIFNPRIMTTEEHYRKVRDVILRFIKQEGMDADVEQINPSAQNEWYYIFIAIAEAEIAGRNVFTDVNFANQMISWFPWLFHFDKPEEKATFKRKFTKSISAERSLWKYGAKKEVTAIKDMWARQRTLGIDYAKLSRLYPVANDLKKALEELKTEIVKAQSAKR